MILFKNFLFYGTSHVQILKSRYQTLTPGCKKFELYFQKYVRKNLITTTSMFRRDDTLLTGDFNRYCQLSIVSPSSNRVCPESANNMLNTKKLREKIDEVLVKGLEI